MRSTLREMVVRAETRQALRTRRVAALAGALTLCLAARLLAATGVAVPAFPALRPIPPAERATIDYAESACADAWLRHPILGDPSFDAFTRPAGNPLVRGTAPFLWPVNVFLLDDPRSGCKFAYVGHYLAGYDLGPGKPPAHCRVWRQEKGGATWTDLGPVFDSPDFRFAPGEQPANIAPDVSVVFADGRYHMGYDWATADTTWENAAAPGDGADTGAAYAWSERPEGPFHRETPPILRTSGCQHLRRAEPRGGRRGLPVGVPGETMGYGAFWTLGASLTF